MTRRREKPKPPSNNLGLILILAVITILVYGVSRGTRTTLIFAVENETLNITTESSTYADELNLYVNGSSSYEWALRTFCIVKSNETEIPGNRTISILVENVSAGNETLNQTINTTPEISVPFPNDICALSFAKVSGIIFANKSGYANIFIESEGNKYLIYSRAFNLEKENITVEENITIQNETQEGPTGAISTPFPTTSPAPVPREIPETFSLNESCMETCNLTEIFDKNTYKLTLEMSENVFVLLNSVSYRWKVINASGKIRGPTGEFLPPPVVTPLPRVIEGDNIIYGNDFETSIPNNTKVPLNLLYGYGYGPHQTAQWNTNEFYIAPSPSTDGNALVFDLTASDAVNGVRTDPIPLQANAKYEINFYANPKIRFVGNSTTQKFFMEFFIVSSAGDLIDYAVFFGEKEVEIAKVGTEFQANMTTILDADKLPNGWLNITAAFADPMPSNASNLIIYMGESSENEYEGTIQIDNLVLRKV